MRQARESDFFVDLPDVGAFRFGRRTYGDRLKIRSEYLRLVKEFGDVCGHDRFSCGALC